MPITVTIWSDIKKMRFEDEEEPTLVWTVRRIDLLPLQSRSDTTAPTPSTMTPIKKPSTTVIPPPQPDTPTTIPVKRSTRKRTKTVGNEDTMET